MKLKNAICIITVISFYYLSNQFLDFGGLIHQLLKILFELIIVTPVMATIKYENEIKEITDFDEYPKKLDNYFKKNGK